MSQIPDEAVEAVRIIIYGDDVFPHEGLEYQRERVMEYLTAAYPAIERRVRAQVAAEIRGSLPESGPGILITMRREAIRDGMNEAARIAEGKE